MQIHTWEGRKDREVIAHTDRQPNSSLETVRSEIITFRLKKQRLRVKACVCIATVLLLLRFTKYSVVRKPVYQNVADCVQIERG
jgi:hypothetical protein